MRKLLFIFMLGFIITCACAQTSAVKKIIKKYDAPYLRKVEGFKNPDSFWKVVEENDPNVKKLGEAYERKDKTLFEAFDALLYFTQNHSDYDFLTSGYDSIVNRLVHDLGIEEMVIKNPVKVIKDYEINASMDALEQLRINYGCFERLTYGELLAVCAHEMAHCACEHVSMRVWKSAKKEKKNKMWADIGTSIAVGVFAATAGYGAYNGQDVSHFNNIIANADILYYGAYNYANEATLNYTYRYSRDEESEADIIAYRFMEQLGYGGDNVLSMLKKLMDLYGDTPAGKYDDHPSTLFRIQVISALMSGYTGK